MASLRADEAPPGAGADLRPFRLANRYFLVAFPVYLVLSFIIVAFEKSSRYIESAGVTVVAVLVMIVFSIFRDRSRRRREVQDI